MPELRSNDQRVLSALTESGKALSAYEVLERARTETLKAPVQIYRALQKLERLGLVHRVEALNAFVACAAHHADRQSAQHVAKHAAKRDALHRPGFVICRDCGTVREFEDARVASVAKKAAGEGFSIDAVSLEIYGQCAPCGALQ